MTKWARTKLDSEAFFYCYYFVNGLALRLYTQQIFSEFDPIKPKKEPPERGGREQGGLLTAGEHEARSFLSSTCFSSLFSNALERLESFRFRWTTLLPGLDEQSFVTSLYKRQKRK